MRNVSRGRGRNRRTIFCGALVGALVGFGVSTITYTLVNPLLERSGGLLRETQGMLWSLVPVLTVLGAVFGRWVARRRAGNS